MTTYQGNIFNMITVYNTTDRSLLDLHKLIVHNIPFFKEVMLTVTSLMVKDIFKTLDKADVIIVKDAMIAAKAHVDNPSATIYILAKNTHCVTLAFKGNKEEVKVVKEGYYLCPSEMIDFN